MRGRRDGGSDWGCDAPWKWKGHGARRCSMLRNTHSAAARRQAPHGVVLDDNFSYPKREWGRKGEKKAATRLAAPSHTFAALDRPRDWSTAVASSRCATSSREGSRLRAPRYRVARSRTCTGEGREGMGWQLRGLLRPDYRALDGKWERDFRLEFGEVGVLVGDRGGAMCVLTWEARDPHECR